MPKPLATQLYTFRDTTRPGVDGLGLDPATLAAIAEIGFLGVETVDVPGGDPGAARRAIEAAGLQVASAHTWTKLDDLDAFDRASAAVAELGSSSIILSGFGLRLGRRRRRVRDRLNAASERRAAGTGWRSAITTTPPRCARWIGVPVYRRLLDRVDPAVAFQVDIFWVQVGGLAPGPVIAELGERVVSLHVKDGVTLPSDAGAEPFVNVAVGQGVIDVAGAVEAAAEDLPRIGWLIVEFDHCDGPPLEAVADSYAYLVSRGLGRGSVGVTPSTGSRRDRRLRQRHRPLPARLRDAAGDRAGRVRGPRRRRRRRRCRPGGFPAVAVDALLADPSIEIVLNLTPPTAHVGVSRAAIAAGKHVYSEKPFATTRADAAAILADGAAAGVVVGGAPGHVPGRRPADGPRADRRGRDRRADRGERRGHAPGPERWHPNPSLPGRAAVRCWTSVRTTSPRWSRSSARSRRCRPRRAAPAASGGSLRGAGRRDGAGVPPTRSRGHAVRLGRDRRLHGVVRRRGQRLAAHRDPRHGGVAVLGDPNHFDGAVRRRRFGGEDWKDVPLGTGAVGSRDRARGHDRRDPRGPIAAGVGALAFHALDVLLATETAAATGAR